MKNSAACVYLYFSLEVKLGLTFCLIMLLFILFLIVVQYNLTLYHTNKYRYAYLIHI